MTGAIRAAFRGRVGRFGLDIAFEAPGSGVTALFGPSGCGKTTVLRCLAGLLRLDDGFCAVGGDVWQDARAFRPPHRRAIGYVFQEASLFPHLSVRRNLLFGAPRGPGARCEGGLGLDEAVDLLGLARLLDRAPPTLSGGERQRVAIGRALLSRPGLLLMDEPLSALDQGSCDDILPFLERLRDALALPILYVSHDLAEVQRLARHLVVMEAGRVRAAGPLEDLQSDPTLPMAAGRDAAVSLNVALDAYDAAYGLATLRAGPGVRFLVPGPPGPAGQPRRARIAAGDVSLAREPSRSSTILNVLPVRILSATPVAGHEMLAVLGLGLGGEGPRILARVTRRSWDTLGFAEGTDVYAQIKSVALARDDRSGGAPPGTAAGPREPAP